MTRVLYALAMFAVLTSAAASRGDQAGSADTPANSTQKGPDLSKLQPVPLTGGTAKLTPQNSRIAFVGLHEGDDPKPRLGGFSKFTGQARVDDAKKLDSVTLQIDTASLWTEIDRLTGHLKSPDFFDVREHPIASFQSTAITPAGQDGKYMIQGDLTLLGVTKSIKVPAFVEVRPEGFVLVSDFAFDRRQFGMGYGQGQVKNDVTVKIRMGEKTDPSGDAAGKRSSGNSGG